MKKDLVGGGTAMRSQRVARRSLIAALLTAALVPSLVISAPAPAPALRTAAAATHAGAPPGLPGLPALAGRPVRVASMMAAGCADRAATWMGSRWRGTVRWRLNQASIPAYLPAGRTRAAVLRAARTVAGATNRCRLPGDLGMSERFVGSTRRHAAVGPDGRCGRPDGTNEVSFGRLAAGLLAVTCVWWRPERRGHDGATVEADIRVSATSGLFFLGTGGLCADSWDLEGALTHEFGHVYGLGHVSGEAHPALTMGDTLPPCDIAHRGLGLGDYAMLRAHYAS
jgi:hypothetical protein